MLEEGLSSEDLRAEVEAIAAAAEAAGVEIVAGDTKVVERGSLRLACTSARPGSGWSTSAPALAVAHPARRPGARLRPGRSARHRDHAGARRARARRRIASDTRLALARGRCDARCRRRCFAACATRPAAASPRSSTSWPSASRSAIGSARATFPSSRPSPPPPSCWASTRCTSRTRASSSPSSPRRPPMRRSPRCGPSRLRAGNGDRRRQGGAARHGPRRDRFGGRRVMDQLVGDPLPRIC